MLDAATTTAAVLWQIQPLGTPAAGIVARLLLFCRVPVLGLSVQAELLPNHVHWAVVMMLQSLASHPTCAR